MTISYKLDSWALHPPTRAHAADAGFDLYAPFYEYVPAHGRAVIDTGVHFNIPAGWRAMLYSKSGLMAKGITCRGLIDAGYTGSVKVVLFNNNDIAFTFEPGDKITQIIFEENPDIELVETDTLEETERGSDGFGSTGA